MSATGRIKVVSPALPPPTGCSYPEGTTLRAVTRTPRAKGDFYETPAWAVSEILPHVRSALETAALVIDAGAGTGAISAVIAGAYPHLDVVGIEKRPELLERARARGLYAVQFIEGDFERDQLEAADVVIMNPPYSRAIEFVQRALTLVKRGGTVAALLRLSFLAGKGRREFHAKHPADVFVLAKRPSFTGGGTDATDYAWFVFGPGRGGRVTILPCTAAEKPKKGKRAARNTRAKKEAGGRGLAQAEGAAPEGEATHALPSVPEGVRAHGVA